MEDEVKGRYGSGAMLVLLFSLLALGQSSNGGRSYVKGVRLRSKYVVSRPLCQGPFIPPEGRASQSGYHHSLFLKGKIYSLLVPRAREQL